MTSLSPSEVLIVFEIACVVQVSFLIKKDSFSFLS